MSERVARKWRPTLGLVVFAVLAAVLALPLVGLYFFRLYENTLIRQTESELIAQGAVLAAVFAREVEALPQSVALGQEVPKDRKSESEPYQPIEPNVDLTRGDLLGRRPDALPATVPAEPAFVDIGDRLQPIARAAQQVTLAGFRILDSNGVVIAGRGEVGQSLAHVEEVKAALKGRYRAVLRTRVSDNNPPPLYSISRGTSVRVFAAMPVVVRDKVAGVIYASRTPNNIVKHVYGERRKFVLAGLTVLTATVVIGLVFSRFISRPINRLVTRTSEVGRRRGERFDASGHYGTREIALLADSFAAMTERLDRRSEYISTFAAHVSHELKTPLTSIQGAAELLREDGSDARAMSGNERVRFLGNILADTTRLTAILNRLRELARADAPTRGRTTLAEAVAPLRSAHPELAITAEGALEAPMAISAENAAIVLSHLADNAVCHGATSLGIVAREAGSILLVEIDDDGEGVAEKHAGQIFDPFFTTRRKGGGTGMGLAIVSAMLRAHGGAIRLLPSRRGARFEIEIAAA